MDRGKIPTGTLEPRSKWRKLKEKMKKVTLKKLQHRLEKIKATKGNSSQLPEERQIEGCEPSSPGENQSE